MRILHQVSIRYPPFPYQHLMRVLPRDIISAEFLQGRDDAVLYTCTLRHPTPQSSPLTSPSSTIR